MFSLSGKWVANLQASCQYRTIAYLILHESKKVLQKKKKKDLSTEYYAKLLFSTWKSEVCVHHWPVKERCLFSFQISTQGLGAAKQIARDHPKVSTTAKQQPAYPYTADNQPLLRASATVHLLVSTQSRIPQAPCTLNVKGKIILAVNVYLGQHSYNSQRKTPAWKCEMLLPAEGGWQMLRSTWM